MGTTFDEIEDLALIELQDYKIVNLAKTDMTALRTYLDGLVIRSVPKFAQCLQSTEYDIALRQFNSVFTNIEKEILAEYVAITWMTSIVQDVTQFNLHLQNKEFKIFSEAENLKQKSEYLDRMREKARQLTTDYQIVNINQISYFAR